MATALEMLLAKLANERNAPLPAPAAPMNLGPLSNDTSLAFGARNPEPVPPRFTQPAGPDMNFINSYAGPEPTRPVLPEPNLLDKITAVLTGVAYGPQGVEQVRRQRNEPIEQYRQDTAAYEGRRTRALEIDERRAEREADRANRAAELQYQRDFNLYLKSLGIRQHEADERTRQAFQLRQDADRFARDQAEEIKRERRAQQLDAKQKASRYFTVTKNMALSKELGDYWAGISDRPLSPAAVRLDAQLEGIGQAKMSGAGRGGGGGKSSRASSAAQATLDAFNLAKQGRIEAIRRGDKKSEQAFKESMNRLYKSLARFPRDVELSTTDPDWPFARLRNAPAAAPAQQPQAQAKVITRAEMAALGITEAQARAEGYTIQ